MASYPLVSFALFTYNQEPYIEAAVRAAFAQQYPNLEIVISDDCSSDRTFAIIQRLAGEYRGPHQVRINRNPRNLGIGGHTSRMMLELVRGELIVTAAGDDVSRPERTAVIHEAWERSGRRAYAILSGYQRMSAQGEFQEVRCFDREEFVGESISGFLGRNRPMYAPGCAQACHRDVFARFGPIPEAPEIEDNSIMIRARMLGEVLLLKEVLVYWRRSGVVSFVGERNMMWEQDARFRRQVRRQVLADLRRAPRERLRGRDRPWRISLIARAGIMLASPHAFIVRLLGWLLLVPFCTIRESLFNLRLLHRRLSWVSLRAMLGLPVVRG
jgi:hypothetical protein